MVNDNSTKTLTDFVTKNQDKIKNLEIISVLIFMIGFILNVLDKSNLNIILIIGSILTAICYFLYSFSVIETENIETTGILNSIGFINFIYKLTYYSLSISAIAMIGLVIEFKNHNPMLNIGGFTLLIILILSILTKLNDRSNIYNMTFYLRILICLLLLSYLFVIEYNIK